MEKASIVADASKAGSRAADFLLLGSIGLAALARSPKFALKLGVIETPIDKHNILVYGMIAIPLLGLVLVRARRKWSSLRDSFIADHQQASKFERTLVGLDSPNWKFKLRYGVPFLVAIGSMITMLFNYYATNSNIKSVFLAYEKTMGGGVITYEPWFSFLFIFGLGFLVYGLLSSISPQFEVMVRSFTERIELVVFKHGPEKKDDGKSTPTLEN